MKPIVIVSNRTPGKRPAAGGLAVALKKVLKAREGFWFGWSGKFADGENSEAKFESVNDLRVATIDLPRDDYAGYYEGFSNSVLWPAFHNRLDLVKIVPAQFDAYMRVNRRFAEALAKQITPDHTIWVHDYHLIPLARELRAMGVDNKIGFFLHIPLPPPETFSAIPHHAELLECLSCYDTVGLQARRDVDALTQQNGAGGLPSERDLTRAVNHHMPDVVAAIPIGTDAKAFEKLVRSLHARRTAALVDKSIAGRAMILGVDRLDYSKGLPERIAAYERLLDVHPEWRRKVHMLQVAPTSRSAIAEYKDISDELDAACGRVIGRFAEPDWCPLNYVKRTHPQSALAGLYRIARVALVTPLRDGMNLVAHEFVACQKPHDPGVLVLSRFAGAAELFPEALLVNPHDLGETAEALDLALKMPRDERIARWKALRQTVEDCSVDAWAQNFLQALAAAPEWRERRQHTGGAIGSAPLAAA